MVSSVEEPATIAHKVGCKTASENVSTQRNLRNGIVAIAMLVLIIRYLIYFAFVVTESEMKWHMSQRRIRDLITRRDKLGGFQRYYLHNEEGHEDDIWVLQHNSRVFIFIWSDGVLRLFWFDEFKFGFWQQPSRRSILDCSRKEGAFLSEKWSYIQWDIS